MKITEHIVMTSFLSIGWLACVVWSFFLVHNTRRDAPAVPSVDVIIFSFDRPMQLYGLLESMQLYLRGLGNISIIYRTSSPRFEKAYQIVQKDFPKAHFIAQGASPTHDFKPLVLQTLRNMPSEYVLFAVDDMLVKHESDLAQCVQLLEKYDAYGFYLRLGTHLDSCYTHDSAQPLPPLKRVQDDVYAWSFQDGCGDWSYAHTVDMTLYRKKQVLAVIESIHFCNPNTFEGRWAAYAWLFARRTGLCFEQSVALNIPANIVQEHVNNRHMSQMSTQKMLEFFENGLAIAFERFYGLKNSAAHIEMPFEFRYRSTGA